MAENCGNNLDSEMFRAAHDSVVWAVVVDNAASADPVSPLALRCMVGHRNLNYLHRRRHYRLDLAGEILSNENRKKRNKILVKCQMSFCNIYINGKREIF